MTHDPLEPAVHSFPYRTGWHVIGCSALFFSLLGGIGCVLLPFGWGKLQQGQLPLGVAYMTIGLFGIPMVVMAIGSLVTGIRQTVRPPLLGVTASSLRLPDNLRKESTPAEHDEHGVPQHRVALAHPEEIPFAAIRSVRREGPRNPGSDRLIIAHDLATAELVFQQCMMCSIDFDELETVLRTAIPPAFETREPAKRGSAG